MGKFFCILTKSEALFQKESFLFLKGKGRRQAKQLSGGEKTVKMTKNHIFLEAMKSTPVPQISLTTTSPT